MKLVIKSALFIALLISLFFLTGAFAPSNYTGQVITTINCPPDAIWKLLTDVNQIPEHRPTISSVVHMGKNTQGLPVWRQITNMGGQMDLEIIEANKPKMLTIHLINCSFGMKGTWQYKISSTNGRSVVTITESSHTHSLLTRSFNMLSSRSKHLEAEADWLHQQLEK